MVDENQLVDWRSIRYDYQESRLRAESLSFGAGGESRDPVRNQRPYSRKFRAPSERRPPAFRFEAKQPPKLRRGKGVRPVCFERQALERGAAKALA